MEGLMIDGFHGMSSAYFLGCIAESAPTSRVEVPAIAASEGVVAARHLPTLAHSFRRRPRKQTMLTTRAMEPISRALDARKEDDDRRRELAATQKQAAEEAKAARRKRQAATRKNQEVRAQLQQQQAQALEATRASQKATAAAARRATVDVIVEAHKSNQSKAHLPQFVWFPTCGLSRCTSGSTSSSSSSSPMSSGHRRVQGSTACQASSHKDSLTLSPSTPVRKCVKTTPGSPITTDSLPNAVATGSTAGGKGQPGLCHFCHKTSSPAWRRGSAQPYQGLQLCNGCGIWEDRYGSLTACNKAGKSRQAVLAKQRNSSAGNGVVLSQHERRAEAGADQGSEVSLEDKRSRVAQKRGRRHASALSCSAGGQPLQQEQVGFADEESGTEAVMKTGHKRAATTSVLQRTGKRRAEVQTDIGKGAAISSKGGRGWLKGSDSCAANEGTLGGDSNNMVVDGGSQTCQQGRGLRNRK